MHNISQSLGLGIHSPQVLRTLISGIRNFVYELPYKLSNDS